MKATIIFLLVAQVSWAGPFQQKGLFDFMLEDEASGIGPDDRFHEVPELEPMGPVCPFRCQCHLRVVQCSDLGEWDAGALATSSALFMGMASLGVQHFQFLQFQM
ncbi:decorin-like [Cervus canadensis]|uniref:decorin-like n=1 Tax=Cervus canadensis TaxID=1574408 RepID=UPI001CA33FCF|nr:decorin-like [Cervus canadensis]XP_043303377.1 decorin-like [Cervus canadensis]XP_043303378.1 decorin-like [Cervus canadensis]